MYHFTVRRVWPWKKTISVNVYDNGGPITKLQITHYKLQITNRKLQITTYYLQVIVTRKAQITNYKSQTTNHKSQITNYSKLPASHSRSWGPPRCQLERRRALPCDGSALLTLLCWGKSQLFNKSIREIYLLEIALPIDRTVERDVDLHFLSFMSAYNFCESWLIWFPVTWYEENRGEESLGSLHPPTQAP